MFFCFLGGGRFIVCSRAAFFLDKLFVDFVKFAYDKYGKLHYMHIVRKVTFYGILYAHLPSTGF